jgi:hypothetical protein
MEVVQVRDIPGPKGGEKDTYSSLISMMERADNSNGWMDSMSVHIGIHEWRSRHYENYNMRLSSSQ